MILDILNEILGEPLKFSKIWYYKTEKAPNKWETLKLSFPVSDLEAKRKLREMGFTKLIKLQAEFPSPLIIKEPLIPD